MYNLPFSSTINSFRPYINPVKTFKTNFSGTLNILEISKNLPSLRSLIIVTSDKCYENINKNNNYKKEGDKLNGDDPYSASKAVLKFCLMHIENLFL